MGRIIKEQNILEILAGNYIPVKQARINNE